MRNVTEPFVSVVVPVRNAPQRIRCCIEALLNQSYPRERYEVIVVDNGSHDTTPQVVQSYPVTMLVADSMPTPYLARNAGIRHANGEIIALIDANCTPTEQWLYNGVRMLQTAHADLAGGKVTFTFSADKTAAEMADAVLSVNVRYSIEHYRACMAGNLFVRRHVVEAIGLFPQHIRSGGDMLWTRQATSAGYTLVYAAQAEVHYPARRLVPLLKKYYRTGLGAPEVWRQQAQSSRSWSAGQRIVRGFLPIPPARLSALIRERGTADMLQHAVALWLIGWLCKVASNLGALRAIVQK
jgi:glycosyltransferase involved in cell wall biosynthesis